MRQRSETTRRRSARGSLATVAGVLAVLATGGGYALASDPGTLSACVHRSSRLVYTGKCHPGDRKLTWNATGPRGPQGDVGPPGAAGQSVTSSRLPSGGPSCPDGGSKFTSISGVTFACNGPPATGLWAVVDSAGTLLRGSHATAASAVSGGYEVDFDQDINQCSYQATLGANQAEVGEIGVGPRTGNPSSVFVFTANGSGAETAHGFNLAVYC